MIFLILLLIKKQLMSQTLMNDRTYTVTHSSNAYVQRLLSNAQPIKIRNVVHTIPIGTADINMIFDNDTITCTDTTVINNIGTTQVDTEVRFEPEAYEDTYDPEAYIIEAARLHSIGKHPHTALAGMMYFCPGEATLQVIQRFIAYGLNINASYAIYSNNNKTQIRPILNALEYHEVKLIQALLNAGADVKGLCGVHSAVNVALRGHSNVCREDWIATEIIVRMLDLKAAPKVILRSVLTKCCDIYIEESRYLRDYIKKCKIIEDIVV
jgi:hypothetical protein